MDELLQAILNCKDERFKPFLIELQQARQTIKQIKSHTEHIYDYVDRIKSDISEQDKVLGNAKVFVKKS